MIIRCELMPGASVPARANETDSGADLSSNEVVTVYQGETVRVRTGLRLELPSGYEAQVRPRSGLTSRGRIVHFGTVDEGYRGEISVVATNLDEAPWTIKNGDRIAQLVISPVVKAAFRVASGSIQSTTERGENGFGSTGIGGRDG